jgi:hypothetical protein
VASGCGLPLRARSALVSTHVTRAPAANASVADATISEVSYDDSSGCYFDSAPRAGGTEFTGAEMVAWANAGGSVKCVPSLVIRGPRGLAYNARP